MTNRLLLCACAALTVLSGCVEDSNQLDADFATDVASSMAIPQSYAYSWSHSLQVDISAFNSSLSCASSFRDDPLARVLAAKIETESNPQRSPAELMADVCVLLHAPPPPGQGHAHDMPNFDMTDYFIASFVNSLNNAERNYEATNSQTLPGVWGAVQTQGISERLWAILSSMVIYRTGSVTMMANGLGPGKEDIAAIHSVSFHVSSDEFASYGEFEEWLMNDAHNCRPWNPCIGDTLIEVSSMGYVVSGMSGTTVSTDAAAWAAIATGDTIVDPDAVSRFNVNTQPITVVIGP